jgi:ABC-type sugar transport system ATPase subunit
MVTVIKDGRPVATSRSADTNRAQLEMSMVGSAVATTRERAPAAEGESVLKLTDLGVRGQFQDVSLSLQRGQVLGIAGLMDSGAGALAMTIFGAQRPKSGTIHLDGKVIRFRGPHNAVSAGVGFIPSDRDRDGIILGISIQKNVALAALPWVAQWGFLNPRRERRLADDLIDRLKIKCNNCGDLPMRLSGGNRQKVALAKWLARTTKVLVLHNPTRGVDVEGYADIHRLIVECAEQGVGVVLVTDNLAELLELSDHIVIMRRGRISGTFARRQNPTERQLVDLML